MQASTPGGFRHPEDILSYVFVAILWVSKRIVLELGIAFLEGVRDIFEEKQAQSNVFILRWIKVPSHLIR
jgi:hypothetical protein